MHTLLAAAKHQQRARSASTDTRHTRARPNFTMQTDADSAQMDQLQLCGREGRQEKTWRPRDTKVVAKLHFYFQAI